MEGLNGLLDFIKTPEGQGLLAGAFGYAANARKGTPWNNAGRGGIAGLMGYANALDRQDQQAENQFQKQYRQMQMDEMQRKIDLQKGQDAWRAGLPGVLQQQTMVPNDAGPTAAPDTEAINKYLLDPRSPFADKLIEKRLFPKEEEAYTLGEGQVRYKGDQVVARGPEKIDLGTTDWQNYQKAVQEGYQGSFTQYQINMRRSGAPNVTLNTNDPSAVAKGGLDFTRQYEAQMKGPRARAQAYSVMMDAYRNPSPKGDIAMVYSMVKALDPESVVREGEISLLEANRSIPDTIKGYARKLATGESLLPHERADMMEQARRLTMNDYQATRGIMSQYQRFATPLGLDPEKDVPDPYAGIDFSPKKFDGGGKTVKRTGTYQGRKVIEYTDGTVEYGN